MNITKEFLADFSASLSDPSFKRVLGFDYKLQEATVVPPSGPDFKP
jgi:hypothetical protein